VTGEADQGRRCRTGRPPQTGTLLQSSARARRSGYPFAADPDREAVRTGPTARRARCAGSRQHEPPVALRGHGHSERQANVVCRNGVECGLCS
jgi:hypothetical protein